MKLYLIYDKVAKVHGPVFQQSNDASCARSLFRSPDIVADVKDLVIYSIGYFEKNGEEECYIPHETGKKPMLEFLDENGIKFDVPKEN